MTCLAVLLLIFIVLVRRRGSGVYANPHSLAAIATLAHSPQLLDIFRALPPGIREKQLGNFLRENNYGLGYYHSSDGTMAYGILVDPHGSDHPHGLIEYSTVNLNEGVSAYE